MAQAVAFWLPAYTSACTAACAMARGIPASCWDDPWRGQQYLRVWDTCGCLSTWRCPQHGGAAETLCHPCTPTQTTLGWVQATVGGKSWYLKGGGRVIEGPRVPVHPDRAPSALAGRKLSGKAGIDEVMAAAVLTSLSASPLVLGHPPATHAPGESVSLSPLSLDTCPKAGPDLPLPPPHQSPAARSGRRLLPCPPAAAAAATPAGTGAGTPPVTDPPLPPPHPPSPATSPAPSCLAHCRMRALRSPTAHTSSLESPPHGRGRWDEAGDDGGGEVGFQE